LVIEYNTGLVDANVLGDALRIYDVNLSSSKPVFTSAINHNETQTICAGETASFSPIANSNYELLWYDSINATTLIAIKPYNETFVTPALYANKTYYVATRVIGCISTSERVSANVIVNPEPTITIDNTLTVCQEQSIITLAYTATTNNPTSYSISWDIKAKNAGFTDQINIALDIDVITISVPSGAFPDSYTGNLKVKNDLGCDSVAYTFNLNVHPKPSQPNFNLQ